jgi:hypothetical protein
VRGRSCRVVQRGLGLGLSGGEPRPAQQESAARDEGRVVGGLGPARHGGCLAQHRRGVAERQASVEPGQLAMQRLDGLALILDR